MSKNTLMLIGGAVVAFLLIKSNKTNSPTGANEYKPKPYVRPKSIYLTPGSGGTPSEEQMGSDC